MLKWKADRENLDERWMQLLVFVSEVHFQKWERVSTIVNRLVGFAFRVAEKHILVTSATRKVRTRNVLWMQERIERSAVIVPTSNRFLESRCQSVDDATKLYPVHRKLDTGRVEKVVVIHRKCHVRIEPSIGIPRTRHHQSQRRRRKRNNNLFFHKN